MPQQWSIKELEAMDEVAWRIYLSMRLDDLEGVAAPVPDITKRCAARAWHGPALKGLIGTAFTAMLGALAWLIVKVWG